MTDRARSPVDLHFLQEDAPYARVLDYCEIFEHHGCIVGPSDTGFGIFTPATDPEAVNLVYSLTGRRDDPLPVVVGTVRQASETIQMNEIHKGFMSTAWPGAFTAVARTTRKARFIKDIVNRTGTATIGVRVSNRTIEARLSNELDVPIVSTAVRRADTTPVRSWVEARQIISAQMTLRELPENRVAFTCSDDTFRYRTHSTVGQLIPADDLINVLREGVYSRQDVINLVNKVKLRWTDPQTWEDVT